MFNFFKKKKNTPVERKTDDLKISVIMPVFLGAYEGCADNREEKFKSAVISFVRQSYENKELIIVADGCDEAEKIYNECLVYDTIIFKKIKKQPLFSGRVRDEGLKLATGDIICYLDSDDMFGEYHLQSIVDGFSNKKELDWVYYNDLIVPPKSQPQIRNVSLEHGSIGTSTVAHRIDCNVSWKNMDGYGHDWKFIQQLLDKHPNYEKIFGAQYYVCHLANIF